MLGVQKQDDERVMNWIYQIEQDAMFGSYQNDYEGFIADWKAEKYEPVASLSIPDKYVEIIEFIKAMY